MELPVRRRAAVRAGGGMILALAAVAAMSALPVAAQTLYYGDGVPDGKRSFGGNGHLTMFEAPREGMWVNAVEVFGSRYGAATPPDEDFDVYVVDGQRNVLRKIALPYCLWERGQEYWRELPAPPIRVPQRFGIGLVFHAHQTKGVYVGFDKTPTSRSYSWVPGQQGALHADGDWMVRLIIGDEAEGDPEACDLVLLHDGEAFMDRLLGMAPAGAAVNVAGRGALPRATVASLRLGVVTAPAATSATLVLVGGARVDCEIVSVDETSIVVLDARGVQRRLNRADVTRMDLR